MSVARIVATFVALALVLSTSGAPAQVADPELDAGFDPDAGAELDAGSGAAAEPPAEPPAEPSGDIVFPQLDPSFVVPKRELSDPKRLEPALRKALDVPGGFCKTADYELSTEERRLCSLAEAGRERCPAFIHACQREQRIAGGRSARESTGREHRHLEARRGSGEGSSEGSDASSPTMSSGPLGELLGGLMKAIFWCLLIVGIGAMVYAAIKALIARRKDPKSEDDGAPGATVAPVPRQAPPGSPEDLLDRSRRLAAAGELQGAMGLLLRALLRHLEIGGRLELHPSRTNGDYVRSLRRQGHDSRELKRVAIEVEAIEFGGAPASSQGFSSLYERVAKLVQVTGVVVLFVALGALGGCRQRKPSESAVASCGSDAAGYSALCDAMEARGLKIHRRFTAVEYIPKEINRVVVLADDLDEEERQVLVQWVQRGGKLVLFDATGSYGERLIPATVCTENVTLSPTKWSVPPGEHRFGLPRLRAFNDALDGRVPVSCGTAPVVVDLDRGEGTITAVADWRFATNASLAVGDNAALAASLVGAPGDSVELVGAWTGTGTDLPAESLSRSGLVPWFLQILLLGFVFALYRGSPFGTRREPVTVTRRAFAEHALALGDAYSRARASRLALVNFGSWALERLRVRLAATKQGRLSDLASAVAARHSVTEAEVMSLVVAVRSAEDQAHDSATEAEHLAALRRLAALVKKTGGSS